MARLRRVVTYASSPPSRRRVSPHGWAPTDYTLYEPPGPVRLRARHTGAPYVCPLAATAGLAPEGPQLRSMLLQRASFPRRLACPGVPTPSRSPGPAPDTCTAWIHHLPCRICHAPRGEARCGCRQRLWLATRQSTPAATDSGGRLAPTGTAPGANCSLPLAAATVHLVDAGLVVLPTFKTNVRRLGSRATPVHSMLRPWCTRRWGSSAVPAQDHAPVRPSAVTSTRDTAQFCLATPAPPGAGASRMLPPSA